MMRRKGSIGNLLGVLLLVMVALSVLPAQALAYSVDIQNPYPDKMDVAVIDFDDPADTWRCHGWWVVQPYSTRRITMPDSTAKNHIYLFVKTSEARWSGEGISSSIVRTVNNNAFSYLDGQSCPPGPNRRQEFFVKYELKDGFLYWAPE
ncbi:MAG: hypothetical protein H6Q66_2948 [Firmicutes bacterium]|nr:hypothetical protein [Bacillota bacterium]